MWLRKRLVAGQIFLIVVIFLVWCIGNFDLRPRRLFPPPLSSEDLIVALPGYGSFQGTLLYLSLKGKKALSKPVVAWLNVEFSVQPVGANRFMPVTWPEPFEGVKDATTFGPSCPQNLRSAAGQSEACLTINVYRPTGIPMDQKLPVFVYLHGGSFVVGSHRSFDATVFIEQSIEPLMVVTAQYRLGALGSLPAKFMEEEDLLNLGVRDQRMMLEFVHKYITFLGGDPEKVTLGGQSAGGHSVGIQLFHDYGEGAGRSLFHQAILSSGSPIARAFPGVDYPLYENQVNQFMTSVKCPLSSSSAALDCLRAAKLSDIQYASARIYNEHNYNITWPWQPVSPGPWLEQRGTASSASESFFKLPTLISSTTDEGKLFAPQNMQSDADFRRFWSTLTPSLTPPELDALQTLYPPTTPTSLTSSALLAAAQFERLAASYGDYAYICAVQDTASVLARAGAPVYKARFNTPAGQPAFMGVPHGSDAPYFNGMPELPHPEVSELYSAYYASFVVTGDPNRYKVQGAPVWERYAGEGGKELVVSPQSAGGAGMENEEEGIRMEQCRWWRDPERAKRLNK